MFVLQQKQAAAVLLQHHEVCQPHGAAGVPVSHPTGVTPSPLSVYFFFSAAAELHYCQSADIFILRQLDFPEVLEEVLSKTLYQFSLTGWKSHLFNVRVAVNT